MLVKVLKRQQPLLFPNLKIVCSCSRANYKFFIAFSLLTLVKSDLILLEGLSGEGDSLSFNLESMSLTNYSCITTNMGFWS